MQKIKKIVISFILIVVLALNNPVYADFGDYESYDSWDSGSSWDSDWDSDWDSSSSWDDDWGSSSSRGNVYFFGGGSSGIFVIIMFIIIIYIISKSKHKHNHRRHRNNININRTPRINPFNSINETEIENRIQSIDELFNKDEFLFWASDLFVKLQYAWSDRDLETMRCFQTPELYEQSVTQIERYIRNKQVNKIERVSVNIAKLYKFSQEGDRDILEVILESKMIDYIVSEESGLVLKGDTNLNKVNTYILTFIRKTGTKTRQDGEVVNTMNCPNCGAPTKVTSSGKCEYCGSIITTEDHNWSLASLKRYNPNM